MDSRELTAAISNFIISQVPQVIYTPEDSEKARAAYTPEEMQLLRDAGWLENGFECFYVINRFLTQSGFADMADDRCLREIFRAARKLDAAVFRADPYLSAIRVPEAKIGRFTLTHASYDRGELLQYGMPDLRKSTVVPKLGFFTEKVSFPAVYEGDMPWVSVCPSEISSMGPDVERAHGNCLVLGLGLGWYPFMISNLNAVESVTVVEISEEIISLFEKHILPQFPHREKIRVLHADAFDVLNALSPGEYDFCYADIWESQVDGAKCCKRIFPHEKRLSGTEFRYWIEDEIRWWMEQEED